MTAFVDTNVLIRHLTGLIVAEVVHLLESFYEVPRPRVAELDRAIIAFPAIEDADAYLVAEAETSGVNAVASFDKTVERVPTVRRVAP